jgi:hypothetical protein
MEGQNQNNRHYGQKDKDGSNYFHPPRLEEVDRGQATLAVTGTLSGRFLLVLQELLVLILCAMALSLLELIVPREWYRDIAVISSVI